MGIPLLNPIVTGVVDGLVGATAFSAVNNYISKSSSIPSAPTIPTSKGTSRASSKTAQKASLSNYATGMGGILAGAAAVIGSSVSFGKSEANSASANQSAKTSELLSDSAASPLLTNQVFMKDSIDKLIDAINANSLVTASVLGTLDANLSAIGSSLTSISATLIEVSDNYSRELNNTDDLPYINQDDYYDMLSESGLSSSDVDSLKNQEDMLYSALKAQGYEYDEIKAQIQNWRKYTVPIDGQSAVEKELSGISRAPRIDSEGNKIADSSSASLPILELPNLEKWAESQFSINEYLTTPSSIRDLDGNAIASVKPIEAQSIKNITDARYKTDVNNFEMDSGDFDDLFGADMPDIGSIFEFVKKSDRIQEIMSEVKL